MAGAMNFAFEAYVTEIIADGGQAAFTLGDGAITWEDGARAQAHDGAILCAVAHPLGQGVITGGDDGRLVWSRRGETQVLAEAPKRWIDAVTASPTSGLIAFSTGREAQVLDANAPEFRRIFVHPASVAAVAFDPKGRRLAAATYGGVALWYARIAEQKPVMLRWAGSHVGLAFSPDGRFLVASMQEPALHGWRLADAQDMHMGGYPAQVGSLAFLGGAGLATSGANGVVLWPFIGANGPMGRQSTVMGGDESSLVTRVAGDATGAHLVAGLDNGRVWIYHLAARQIMSLRPETGPPITALTVLPGHRVAWGDDAGGAGILNLSGR